MSKSFSLKKLRELNLATLKAFTVHTATGPVRIWHNLPNIRGVCIEDVFEDFKYEMQVSKRCEITAENLVAKIDRTQGYYAFTDEQYKKLKRDADQR